MEENKILVPMTDVEYNYWKECKKGKGGVLTDDELANLFINNCHNYEHHRTEYNLRTDRVDNTYERQIVRADGTIITIHVKIETEQKGIRYVGGRK